MVSSNGQDSINSTDWFEDYVSNDADFQIDEYDLTSSPSDFNVRTIFDFIESGRVVIPEFQRNYVWDIDRASKLIESLILGLPVPQIFLYEEERNKFLVIDGQQRLMTIYYFIKQRFPRRERRGELRLTFDKFKGIPDQYLHDDKYFTDFKLKLPEKAPEHPNKFQGLKFSTLGDYTTQFELRPIRNIIVKQNAPKDDDSAKYEIFNRLNSGGVNLAPQEIRVSMYPSGFYDMLYQTNALPKWRDLLQAQVPDLHAKDVEILLRGFAMLIASQDYAPSLTRFLNDFSRRSKANTQVKNDYLSELFKSFLDACSDLSSDAFLNKKTRRFNIALFEAVFVAVTTGAFNKHDLIKGKLNPSRLAELESDPEFMNAASKRTTDKTNVDIRLRRARELVGAL